MVRATPTSVTAIGPEAEKEVTEMAAVPAEVWFALAGWAKETKNLQGWQRKIAYSLGTLAGRGRRPSPKQARQGAIILAEARRLGFRNETFVAG